MVIVAIHIATIVSDVTVDGVFHRLEIQLFRHFPGKFGTTEMSVTRCLFVDRLVQMQITVRVVRKRKK